MNVKKLIMQMKTRPQMYVGEPNLESIYHFINGFLYNNISANRADDIDLEFKNRFHNWVKERLERSQDVKFNAERNYVFYLNQVFQDSSQKINIFFEFCEDFFCEMDKE